MPAALTAATHFDCRKNRIADEKLLTTLAVLVALTGVLVTGEIAVRENRQFWPGQPVSQSLLRKHQKCKSPLNSGLCGGSAVSLWGESLTRRLYGGGGSLGRDRLHKIP